MLEWFLSQQKKRQYFLHFSALIAGLLLPFSFAPYDIVWLVIPLIAWLFLISIEQSPANAFKRGWFFGLGWFGHGLYWLYYSLHVHGNAPIALVIVILFFLACYMALFPAFALWCNRKFFKVSASMQLAIILPLSWYISEWLRGYFLTGFPWLEIGYTQIDTILNGYVPIIGNIGLSWVLALISGLLVLLFLEKRRMIYGLVIGSLLTVGFILQNIQWTQKIDKPIVVSLIQGNIAQKDKWKRSLRKSTIDMYTRLSLQQKNSDVIIWPETAVPGFLSRVKTYLTPFQEKIKNRNQDLLYGLFVEDQATRQYYNSVVDINGKAYHKRHLVPLGEYFPFQSLMGFLRQWMDIPMSDIATGDDNQKPLMVAGQPVGVSICFEDAFDRNVLSTVPEATILINVSNDAWFEDSTQPLQHHQIARMRALETGRYLLRVTNTGLTSIIKPDGKVLSRAPQFERYVLTDTVYAMEGSTPYVVWQNYLLMSGATLVLFGFYWRGRRA